MTVDEFHMFVHVFFFFKQKTAYEMRISDWSSDVCSSDLVRSISLSAIMKPTPSCSAIGLPKAMRSRAYSMAMSWQRWATPSQRMQWEIGRAACRERVCQYV